MSPVEGERAEQEAGRLQFPGQEEVMILTDAWLRWRARLLVTWGALIAFEPGHALLAWTLASEMVANLAQRANGMTIADCICVFVYSFANAKCRTEPRERLMQVESLDYNAIG